MDLATAIGAAAALCSVTSFLPQAWKVIRTRNTGAISTAMYGITVVGFALWLVYGWLLGRWPLIVTNGICLLLASFILAMKMASPRGKETIARSLDPTA